MSIQLVLMTRHCDNCEDQNKKIDISQSPFHSSYKLVGFCCRYNAWITLLNDKDFPIVICKKGDRFIHASSILH